MYKIVVSLLFLGVCRGAPDNRGTEFVIAFMENVMLSYEIPVKLYVTTSRTHGVDVTVTSPGWSNPSVNEQFSVTSGTGKIVEISNLLRLVGSVKEKKGIYVTSTDEITIYGENKQVNSNDAFLGLPTDVLGNEYYTVTYYPPYRRSQIAVVGVVDSTTVTITLGNLRNSGTVVFDGVSYNSNDVLTINLDRYDVVQLQSTGDLTGTHITSNNKIAVFSGNKKTDVEGGDSQDHLVEQLPPVNTWGTRFATVPIPMRTVGDFFKIIGSEDNTTVIYTCNLNGTEVSPDSPYHLNYSGEFTEFPLDSESYCYITSDKPIMVVQFVLSQRSNDEPSDPSMILIPPIQQYSADLSFSTLVYSGSGFYENFFMFIVKSDERAGLRIDGSEFPATTVYHDIPGTDLVGGYIIVSEGFHVVRHTLVTSQFGGFLYGRANLETYGFPTGMRLAPINAECVPISTSMGDGLDNDCDGLIDEELINNIDDDNDGRIDEDIATPYPIDGEWGGWGSWTVCNEGEAVRNRACDNPPPQYDGMQCYGDDIQNKTCETPTCPGASCVSGSDDNKFNWIPLVIGLVVGICVIIMVIAVIALCLHKSKGGKVDSGT